MKSQEGLMHQNTIPPEWRKVKSDPQPQASVNLYYGKGMRMEALKRVGNPTGKGGGIRGKVTQWSRASRRRMRNYLLTHRGVGREVSVTLTIPGPPVPLETARHIFQNYSIELTKRNLGAIWRVELQPRGQLHWHLLATVPEGSKTEDLREAWFDQIIKLGWVQVWWDVKKHGRCGHALEEGPDYEIDRNYVQEPGEVYPGIYSDQLDLFEEYGPRPTISFANRLMLPGANKRCTHLDEYDGRGNWLRYISDHATKRKQEQVAESVGRHWGVIGRKYFTEVAPDEVCLLKDREYWQVVRWCQRLATPRIKCPRAPFGRKLGYRISRGRWGTSTWFSSTETIKRMVDHSRSLTDGLHGQSARSS